MRGSSRVGWLLLVLVIAVSACTGTGAGTQGTSTPADTVVLGVQSEPDTLNPILGYAPDGASKLFDGLVARDAQLRLVPALAEALPEVDDDGRTYTFRLREGVTFHDGQPLTAADVVFTYQSILDTKTDTTLRSDLDMISAVEASDERTVVFRLAYPYAPFTQRATVGIVPRHAFAEEDINTAKFNTAPIGTGPFVFVEWTPGDRLVLRANPDYWGGRPAIARLVLAFVPDDNVRATRMEAGDFDGTHLPPKLAAAFRNSSGVTVYDVPSADYRAVGLPMNHPVTGDLAIRRALALAIDRELLVTGILAGTGEPAYGPVAPFTEWFNEDAVPADAGDIDTARALLDEAGWVAGSDGVRVRDGQPARFTLMYPANDALRKELALTVSSMAGPAGIDVEVVGLDWDAIRPRSDQDAVLFGNGTPYDPDFVNYRQYHSSAYGQGTLRYGPYNNPALDRSLDEGRRSRDPAQRQAAYDEFQRLVADQALSIYLVYLDHVFVVRGQYDGIEVQTDPHAHGATHGIWWNIHQWEPQG